MPPASARTLSKSDFKIARECDAKLYFRENQFSDGSGMNPYLRLLAQGGYMVEALACALRPGGITLEYGRNHQEEFARTKELLAGGDVTVFHATILWNRRLARLDILEKRGDELHLFEVKAKSYDGEGFLTKRGTIAAEWTKYIEDVAFQAIMLENVFPQYTITPHLILVDKNKRSAVDDIPALFEITTRQGRHGTDVDRVLYIGDAALLPQLDLLAEVGVASEVAMVREAVDAAAAHFETMLDGELDRGWCTYSAACRKCEFHPEGFAQCWGDLATPDPHLLELFSVGTVKTPDRTPVVEHLVSMKKVSLYDVDPAWLTTKDGRIGPQAERQRRQLEFMRSGATFISPALRGKLEALEFPLHFIDFEAARLALPYHAQMRPYGQLAFQWSCHVVDAPGATPRHLEWLNDEPLWPNLTFASSLRAALGDRGSVLTWTGFEGSNLKEIAREHDVFAAFDQGLVDWVHDLVDRRIVDLHKWACDDFYHPGMGGRTSIKVVLDAMWKTDPAMREQFTQWTGRAVGADEDPYKALPDLVVAGVTQSVHEGTGAVRAYEAMMYGAERHDAVARGQWRKLLLQYCHLDTLSMVLVAEHWRRVTGAAWSL